MRGKFQNAIIPDKEFMSCVPQDRPFSAMTGFGKVVRFGDSNLLLIMNNNYSFFTNRLASTVNLYCQLL